MRIEAMAAILDAIKPSNTNVMNGFEFEAGA